MFETIYREIKIRILKKDLARVLHFLRSQAISNGEKTQIW
jgi:hypothetical protein